MDSPHHTVWLTLSYYFAHRGNAHTVWSGMIVVLMVVGLHVGHHAFGVEMWRFGCYIIPSFTQASDRPDHSWHLMMMQSETFNGLQPLTASGIHAAPHCVPGICSMMFLLISGILLWNVTCIPKIFPMVILVKILINRCINSGRMCLMKCTNEYSKCTNEPFVKRHLVSDFMWFVMWKAVLFGPRVKYTVCWWKASA